MDIGCIEVVVSRKPNTLFKFLRVLLIMLAVCFLFLGLVGIMAAFIPGIGCLVGYYFVNMNVGIDYEYSYVQKELRIAKIMNKERRKEVATYDLEKMEILAPVRSWHLDSYKNRQIAKDVDYSSGEEKQPDPCYYLYLEGNTRVKLELEGEEATQLLDAVKQMAPRKVFTD
ncbi:MAG: hypothetical protein IJV26_07360 [Lachnospiraceae bacterium]|nr:hypothetical protein [Lachnospiraceae bacterium]